MQKRIIALLMALLIFLPCLAAAETLVTSFYPIWLFTRSLTDGLPVTVENLTAPDTGCLHDYQLQTADMRKLAEADAFLINGAGMEVFLPVITEALPDLPVVDASVGIPLLENDESAEFGSSEEGEYNAHLWLDGNRAMQMITNLAEGLIRLLPQYEEQIRANLDAALLRMEEMNRTLTETLSALPRKQIITFHEAFPYFGEAYGLEVIAVGEEVSPSQMARLAELISSMGKPPLFTEPQFENLTARTLATDTGAPLYQLDPIVTGPEEDVPLDYYETVMLTNMETLCEALGD